MSGDLPFSLSNNVNDFPSKAIKKLQILMATAVRVNGDTLRRHAGQIVRVVGQLVDSSSDPFTITTTDGQVVSIHRRSRDAPLQQGWLEVTGRLQGDFSIIEDFTIRFEGEIDRDAWNQMVSLMHRHEEIFG
jgi:hypothetical protein